MGFHHNDHFKSSLLLFQRMTITQLITQNYFILQILPGNFSLDEKLVARQAFAGLLWNKQIYKYDISIKTWRRDFENRVKNKYLGLLAPDSNCSLEDVQRVMESDMMMDDLSFVDKHNLQHLRQTWRNETKGKTNLKLPE